jgi:hypothetical protein
MYRNQKPHLPEATAEGAARYYIDRLQTLATLGRAVGSRSFYLDAECLVNDTDRTLRDLGHWLGFTTPIPSEYQTFSNTGRENAGDTSTRLQSGKVSQARNDYADVAVPQDLMAEAAEAYQRHRASLTACCGHQSVLADAPAYRHSSSMTP